MTSIAEARDEAAHARRSTQPLAGQVAVVTGGGSSIGLASARHLVADGASALLVGRNAEKLRQAAESLGSRCTGDARVEWAIADVTDEKALTAAFEHARTLPGSLSICVASAGGAMPTPLPSGDADVFRAVVGLNLLGFYLTLKHAAIIMIRERTGGSCIAISSTSAVTTIPGLAAYCASKAAVDMLVRVAADELGEHGIRVNAIRPGLTKREAPSPIFSDPDVLGGILERTPLGRTGIPDDSAAAVRFLAGPESSWITGQCLTVDGGSTLRGRPDLRATFGRFAPIVTSPATTKEEMHGT